MGTFIGRCGEVECRCKSLGSRLRCWGCVQRFWWGSVDVCSGAGSSMVRSSSGGGEGGILWGIKLAVEQGFKNIVMEKDCLLVTNALISQKVAHSDFSSESFKTSGVQF